MSCIKNGVVADIAGYRVYGDAFVLPPHPFDLPFEKKPIINSPFTLLIRVCGSRTSVEDWADLGPVDHIKSDTYYHWFDMSKPSSTLIVAPGWSWLGYDGQPLD